MKVVEKNIAELVEYKDNPRINDDAVEAVAESIKAFGWKQPIVVDKNNVIVAGHTRYRAAKLLGLETVPVVVSDDLTDDAINAYRLIDNRSGEIAKWNTEMLEEHLRNINFDFSLWKFEIPEMPTFEMLSLSTDVRGIEYKEKLGIVIDCPDEETQRKAYDYITAGGYNARVVSI